MRAPGEDRIYRVPYGHGELEFMLQPWFDIEVARSPSSTARQCDIVVAGVGKPDDGELASALRAVTYLRRSATPAVRDGGALVIPAQLDEGEGEGLDEALALFQGCLVVIAASEAPEVVRLSGLRAAVDVEEALDIAYEHIGRPQRASVMLATR